MLKTSSKLGIKKTSNYYVEYHTEWQNAESFPSETENNIV